MTDTRIQSRLAAMTRYAADLVQAYPHATAQAISDKLLTVFDDCAAEARRAVAESVVALIQHAA